MSAKKFVNKRNSYYLVSLLSEPEERGGDDIVGKVWPLLSGRIPSRVCVFIKKQCLVAACTCIVLAGLVVDVHARPVASGEGKWCRLEIHDHRPWPGARQDPGAVHPEEGAGRCLSQPFI